MLRPNEERFETHIEHSLIKHGYKSRLYTEYDKNQCQLPEEVIEFVKSTQKEEYDKLYKQFDTSTDKQLCKVINDQISKRGIVDVLRKGVSTRGMFI
jgi:type I restriction enzyme, R subunit